MADDPLLLPRSPEQTCERIRELAAGRLDPHGIERSRLLDSLPYDLALEWLREDARPTREAWEAARLTTKVAARHQVIRHLPHAWNRANARRWLAVQKALAHFRGLYWLLGEDEVVAALADGAIAAEGEGEAEAAEIMPWYGKPQLVRASQVAGVDWRALDDGKWYESQAASDDLAVSASEALGST